MPEPGKNIPATLNLNRVDLGSVLRGDGAEQATSILRRRLKGVFQATDVALPNGAKLSKHHGHPLFVREGFTPETRPGHVVRLLYR